MYVNLLTLFPRPETAIERTNIAAYPLKRLPRRACEFCHRVQRRYWYGENGGEGGGGEGSTMMITRKVIKSKSNGLVVSFFHVRRRGGGGGAHVRRGIR